MDFVFCVLAGRSTMTQPPPIILPAQIVDKALEEPKYSSLYAQLCLRLAEDAPNFDGSSSEIQSSQKQSTVSVAPTRLIWRHNRALGPFVFLSSDLAHNVPHVVVVVSRPSEDCWFPNFKMNLRTAPEMLRVSPSLCVFCCLVSSIRGSVSSRDPNLFIFFVIKTDDFLPFKTDNESWYHWCLFSYCSF